MTKRSPEKLIRLQILISLFFCLCLPGWPQVAESQDRFASWSERPFSTTSLNFEPNVGQVDDTVHYLSRGPGYGVFFTPTETLLVLQHSASLLQPTSPANASIAPPDQIKQAKIHLRFVGKRVHHPHPIGLDQLPGQSHYFVGNDPKAWHTHVPHYAKVIYEGLYPGIDLIYYGKDGQLEYDLVVAPGANPQEILLEIQGAEQLTLLPEGGLSIETAVGEVQHHKPVIYQKRQGVKHFITGAYRLREPNQISFEIGVYDPTLPLYIDPVLSYSSFFESDGVYNLELDEDGNLYLTGAAIDPVPTSENGFLDAFVSKFDPTGTILLYSTFLGGSYDDQGRDVAVDENGNAYVVGISSSLNFPTNFAIQPENGGSYDVFLAKLGPFGASLTYSTYLGGVGEDGFVGNLAVEVDEDGNPYLAGSTNSPDFPTFAAFQPEYGKGIDTFVVKLGNPEPNLIFSTFLGGSNTEIAGDLKVDDKGQAYVIGTTFSEDFPTELPLQALFGGQSDIFLTKFQATGLGLIYSTYLGGEGREVGRGLAINRREDVYLTGDSESDDYPLERPAQDRVAGRFDVVVTRLDPDGRTIRYSTFMGGSDVDLGLAIALRSGGRAWVTGTTESDDFPATETAPQATEGMGGTDAFVFELSAGGRSLEFSTYLGGDGPDEGRAIIVDSGNDGTNVFVGGTTASTDFPRTAPLQPQPSGGFVAKLSETNPPESSQADLVITMADSPRPVVQGAAVTYSITVTNQGPNAATGVTVTNRLPARISLVGVSASQGSCQSQPLVCQLGTVGVGGQATITISGIPLFSPFVTVNSASVLGALPDPDLSNNSVKVFTEVTVPASGPVADLSLVKNDDPDPATIGVPFTYIVTVTNNGPDTAPNVILTDALPPSVSLGSATVTQGTCTGFRELICQLGSLPPESEATLTISAISSAAGDLTNESQVTSSARDPDISNNTDDEDTASRVPFGTEQADLDIAIVGRGRTLNPDISTGRATVTWDMTVVNDGPGLAIDAKAISRIDVAVIDKIPPTTLEHLTLFTPVRGIQESEEGIVECPSCDCTACMGKSCNGTIDSLLSNIPDSELVVTCDLGNFLPDELLSIEFSAELTQGIHTNTAAATALTFDPDSSNNQDTETTTVAVTPGGAPLGNSGGDGGTCFIATAAYGSPLAREVTLLRQFRDEYLLPSYPGQLLVRAYYFSSPPLAAFISQHSGFKAVTRAALSPVVWWAHLTLKSPFLGFAVIVGGLLLTCSLLFLIIRSRIHHHGFSSSRSPR